MKSWLIAYRLNSAFDMNPITSEIIESLEFPSYKEIQEYFGERITILAVTELPKDWRK